MNECQLCKKEVDVNNGGCALMVAFCRNNSTNLSTISFCRDCYKALLQEPIRRLADAACVEWFGVEDDDEG